jgi:hypothetical protein
MRKNLFIIVILIILGIDSAQIVKRNGHRNGHGRLGENS